MKKKVIDWMFGDSLLVAIVKLLIPVILVSILVIYSQGYFEASPITNGLANEITLV